MRAGVDLLALAHPLFPFADILRNTPKDTPIGFFWETFGNAVPRFSKLLAAGFRTFRIQMYWADDHSIVPLDVLQKSLETLRFVTQRIQGIQLYVSPSCEHEEMNVAAVKQRLEMVKRMIPYAFPVNCPVKGKGTDVSGYLCEYHGDNPGRCDLTSTDGTNIYDIDAAKWVRTYAGKNHPCFMHGARFNMREITKPGQKVPTRTERTAAPSVRYYRSILRLGMPMGDAPKPTFQAEPFQAPDCLKSHSEDSQEPNETMPDDIRENRPVLILRDRVSAVELIDVNGKSLGDIPYFGPFQGNMNRYYAGRSRSLNLYGYQIAQKAAKQCGCEFTWLKLGKKIMGPVHFAFRQGTFRS